MILYINITFKGDCNMGTKAITVNDAEWGEFKSLLKENGQNVSWKIRQWVKEYIKENQKQVTGNKEQA